MRIPIMRGTIDRRILVNYRVDPNVLSPILPNPFRPQIVNGYGIAGICLIRLKNIRPQLLPAFAGIGSENAAHRIAVEWEQSDEGHVGVDVPRRDTSSRLNTLAGGRFFPGVHHHARFHSEEQEIDIPYNSARTMAIRMSVSKVGLRSAPLQPPSSGRWSRRQLFLNVDRLAIRPRLVPVCSMDWNCESQRSSGTSSHCMLSKLHPASLKIETHFRWPRSNSIVPS